MAKKDEKKDEGKPQMPDEVALMGMAPVLVSPEYVLKTLEDRVSECQIAVEEANKDIKQSEENLRHARSVHAELIHKLADIYQERDSAAAAAHKKAAEQSKE